MIIHLHGELAVRHNEIADRGGNRDRSHPARATPTCSSTADPWPLLEV